MPDEKVAETLAEIKSENAKFLNQVLFHNERALSWGKYIIRRNEMELGNLAADSFRWKANTNIGVVMKDLEIIKDLGLCD